MGLAFIVKQESHQLLSLIRIWCQCWLRANSGQPMLPANDEICTAFQSPCTHPSPRAFDSRRRRSRCRGVVAD
jgi:hypothetical protein